MPTSVWPLVFHLATHPSQLSLLLLTYAFHVFWSIFVFGPAGWTTCRRRLGRGAEVLRWKDEIHPGWDRAENTSLPGGGVCVCVWCVRFGGVRECGWERRKRERGGEREKGGEKKNQACFLRSHFQLGSTAASQRYCRSMSWTLTPPRVSLHSTIHVYCTRALKA